MTKSELLEALLSCAPEQLQGFYYLTSGCAEIDLLLSWPDGSLWAIEIKRSLTPKVKRVFHSACADLDPVKKFVVYPGTERYRIAADIEAIPLLMLAAEMGRTNLTT